eukprot:2556393-Rhodomonas_salina.1
MTENIRPTMDKNTEARMAALIEKCWDVDPENRPDFKQCIQVPLLRSDAWCLKWCSDKSRGSLGINHLLPIETQDWGFDAARAASGFHDRHEMRFNNA